MAVPELGPTLGRLTAPRPAAGQAGFAHALLTPVRLALATEVMELGATRLSASALAGAWDRAVTDAADRLAPEVRARLAAAAAEARLPRRRARAADPSAGELAAMRRRLEAPAAPFREALAALGSDPAAFPPRADRLGGALRRLDTAWAGLEEAAARELAAWDAEAEELRGWRRPAWPMGLLAAGVLALAGYVGLVLGGYVPVPGWLRPLAEWWWAR